MSSLADTVAVVTGASSGIGRAVALGLAAEGATLCAIGRDAERLAAVTELAQKTAARVLPFRIDLLQDAQIDQLSQDLRRQFERIDLLVLSAGEHAYGRLEDASVEQLDRLYRSNVRAPYQLIQCLLPMLKSAGGQIVFINSSVGLNAPGGAGQFAATQHAVKAIADSLRQEVNGDGVRVLNVFLGRVATPRQERIYAGRGWEYQPELLLQPEDVASMIISAVSLPKTAEVTELNIRPAVKSY